MDKDPIDTLTTPESCEQFATNVEQRGKPELAMAARRRAVELRAAAHAANTSAERDALEAVYAYERVLWTKSGRKVRASRTWQMIDRLGVIPAVEYVVGRSAESTGYAALVDMGMSDKSFEAVVLRHPEAFSAEAVRRSKERLGGHAG
jgi:hypothetical protein